MNIEIPFNDWSKERIQKQIKKATSRYKKYGDVGDTFIVDGFEYELELVIKVPLWFVKEDLYRSEGAESGSEFQVIWTEIHPKKGFRPFDLVWYHHFKDKVKCKGDVKGK